MQTFLKQSLNRSLSSSWIVLKLVIPIYILADVLYCYNLLSYVAFIIEPFTSVLGLPAESALAIISGMFLNLYAAVAFAAPLEMNAQQWSVLAVYLGVAHSLVVESAIMKKVGIAQGYSYAFRIGAGLIIAYTTTLLPTAWFSGGALATPSAHVVYADIWALMMGSSLEAVVLSLKIIVIITSLILIMDFIKSRPFFIEQSHHVSKGFAMMAGVILGITYGAGILIKETKELSRKDILFIATFLSVCHAIIEDTLLFVIFGADFTMVVVIRTLWALMFAVLVSAFNTS